MIATASQMIPPIGAPFRVAVLVVIAFLPSRSTVPMPQGRYPAFGYRPCGAPSHACGTPFARHCDLVLRSPSRTLSFDVVRTGALAVLLGLAGRPAGRPLRHLVVVHGLLRSALASAHGREAVRAVQLPQTGRVLARDVLSVPRGHHGRRGAGNVVQPNGPGGLLGLGRGHFRASSSGCTGRRFTGPTPPKGRAPFGDTGLADLAQTLLRYTL